jgi:hypothetical protein
MLELALATVAAFLAGGAYYALLAGGEGELPPWKLVVEVLRCLVLVAVVAWLAAEAGVDDLAGGLLLGALLFAGFPLVLWVGAIVHEGTPPRTAALHGGDWLLKLLLIGAIVSVI